MLEWVTEQTRISALCEAEELRPFRDMLFTHMTEDVWNNPISVYDDRKCGIISALRRLSQLTKEMGTVIYQVYSDEEIAENPELAEVRLVYMPAETENVQKEKDDAATARQPKTTARQSFVIVCPGGGYARQWAMVEGYPVAEQLNKMDIPAFVLLYRAGQTGLLPKPMEDLAAALRFIQKNQDRFCVDSRHYAVTGFSAGGHLAAEWGTKEEGSRKFGLPAPEMLWLLYSSADTELFYQVLQNPELPETAKKGAQDYLKRVCGEKLTQEQRFRYSVNRHIDTAYPPVFLLQCQDDPVVPVQSSYAMEKALQTAGIPYKAEYPARGGHSFGIGNQEGTAGWIQRAVRFWDDCKK